MRSLIIGYGEIGKSLWNVLSPYYHTDAIDKDDDNEEQYEILHICFPYSKKFIEQVKEYQLQFKPKYTVIHSTVPVGTSRACDAVNSPCLGIHPNLESGLKTFIKFLGGEQASEVADYFRRVGMKVYLFNEPETSELMKILDTTFYGICLEYTKDVKKQCEKLGVPFEAWTIWTENYNRGYEKLGHPEFVRPNLTPIMKKIGGHCVMQNTELIDTPFTNLLKKLNE
jgi:hypothetical protein